MQHTVPAIAAAKPHFADPSATIHNNDFREGCYRNTTSYRDAAHHRTTIHVVPPIIPASGNEPGGPPNIKPPDIPLPIPPPFYPPGRCIQFCSSGDWPPILPPIVIVPGPPIPVGAPPPVIPIVPIGGIPVVGAPLGEFDLPSCAALNPTMLGGYPTPGDLPSWGQPGAGGPSGGSCQWSGAGHNWQNTFPIAVASGQTSFTVNIFDLLGFGSSSYRIDGAAMQVYSTSATAWTVSYQPTSLAGSSSSQFWINFDVPINPIPAVISVTGTVPSGVRNIELTLRIRASTQCGGVAIPNPPGAGSGVGGGPLDLLLPTFSDGRIDCDDNSQGAGVRSMTSCLFSYSSIIVQGQLLSQGSTITTDDPANNCVRHGVTRDSNGVDSQQLVPGEVFRNFAIIAANQCAGSSKTAVAAGPFQPFGIPGHSLCLVHPDHPEICAVH
ncbi:hypothetical protein NUW58_g9891 [Xylaria curta]|uniref:Uncharacterized protein n=1 Tax=Xylaria curta TaxID=42375 RepID=A0ACC1MSZ6_9PEZI|nr:hypothetical protein NUW58_g9891 [Xylaria curta]